MTPFWQCWQTETWKTERYVCTYRIFPGQDQCISEEFDELELVEKVLPGTYEICNAFVRFYFCFLFPHQTSERTEGSTFLKNTSGKNIMIFNC